MLSDEARTARNAYYRERTKRNPEKYRAYYKQYRENHPEIIQACQERFWRKKAAEMKLIENEVMKECRKPGKS